MQSDKIKSDPLLVELLVYTIFFAGPLLYLAYKLGRHIRNPGLTFAVCVVLPLIVL